MLTVAGENEERLIETPFVVAAEAAGATASVAISDTSMRSDLRMHCSCPRPEAPKRCGMRFYAARTRLVRQACLGLPEGCEPDGPHPCSRPSQRRRTTSQSRLTRSL